MAKQPGPHEYSKEECTPSCERTSTCFSSLSDPCWGVSVVSLCHLASYMPQHGLWERPSSLQLPCKLLCPQLAVRGVRVYVFTKRQKPTNETQKTMPISMVHEAFTGVWA